MLLVVVADSQGAQAVIAYSCTMHNRDVDLMTVQCVPSPGRFSQRPEEFYAVGHRFAELSDMLSKGELSVVPDLDLVSL